MKTTVKTMISAIVVGLFIIMAYGSMSDEATSQSTEESGTSKKEESKSWQYSEKVDEMDGTKMITAVLESDNQLKFEFPYGNSTFKLYVRNWNGDNDAFLTCSNCQFIAGFMGEKTYRIKFDDEAPINVTATSPSDGSSDTVFFGSESKIISKLKTAEKIIIEGSFFDAGVQNIKFTSKDFKWGE